MARMALYSSLALLLYICGTSLTEALYGGFSVRLIHRDSSKSPLYHPTKTHFQRVANAVTRSINRANYFIQASVPTNTAQTIITAAQGAYLMSYSIGTPPLQFFGLVDTGSDLVWLQCKPCENCYNQTSPIFDPSKSQTYKTIPCSSTTCQSLPYRSCSSDNGQICSYAIMYGSGSSQGVISEETLTLSSTNGSLVSFPSTVIGCGNNNTGVVFQGQTSGLVGLGRGPFSLISQLGSSIGGKFSYCLVPLMSSESNNSSSKLNFGDNAVVSGDGTVSTPLFQNNPEFGYWITLEAFSVGDNRVEFGSSSHGSSEEGNTIIDSGSTLIHLPHDVYSRLESAVADVVKLKRVEDPTQQLSLCYRTTSEQLELPMITTHFKDADVQLNVMNTFIPVADGVICFAFVSTHFSPFAIFGFLAQQNLLVGYDLQKNIVSFKPTDCTKQ